MDLVTLSASFNASKKYTDSLGSGITNIRVSSDGTSIIFTATDGDTFSISVEDWNAITLAEKEKIDKIVINGSGDLFLSDNGEYKESGSGWDMQVDLTANENIIVAKDGTDPTEYTHLHDIPFLKQHDYVEDTYIEIETQDRTQIDISSAMYFTIKGDEPFVENYTDNSVKFKLKVVKRDGTTIETECVSCTGSETNIYNKLDAPIDTESTVGLWCDCLNNPNGYLPNNRFTASFYVGSGATVDSVTLFDSKTGLVNEAILPASSGNKFNEIKLYDIPDASYQNGTKTPSVLYDSENFGYTAILGANSGRGMGITLGNILAEFDIMTNVKDGLKTWYLSKSVEMGVGEEPSETPIEGTVWTRTFATQEDMKVVIGFVFLVGVGTKIHLKMKSLLNESIIFERDFSFDKVKEAISPAYAIVSDGVSRFVETNQGNNELEVTLISGSLYGVGFPYCTAVMGELGSDYLANRSTLEYETVTKTNSKSFKMDTININKIIGFEDVNEVSCDKIIIPKYSFKGFFINSIGDNAFEYTIGKPIYIYAELTEVGIGNFKDNDGNQLDIYISPKNTGTWNLFESMGYKITPMELPTSTTKQSVLKNDENGVIDWVQDPVRDGCVYLSDKNRIRSIDLGFVFEVLSNSIWIEVGRFSLS